MFVICLHINKLCFVTFLIFSFIFGLLGKMVQVRLVGDLKKVDYKTLIQRCDVEINDV